jgi:AcrR family transcriptional regulator
MKKQRADAVANRARVIEAARHVFAQRGPDADIMEVICRAEVGPGTVYRHFRSKEALLMVIADDLSASYRQGLEAADAEHDPVQTLRALLTHGFRTTERSGWLLDAMLNRQLPKRLLAEMDADCVASRRQATASFERALRKGLEAGLLRPDLDLATAVAILMNATSPRTRASLPAERSAEQLAEDVVSLFLRGAVSSPTPAVSSPP